MSVTLINSSSRYTIYDSVSNTALLHRRYLVTLLSTQDLFSIVACVLHLGNLSFAQERGSRTQITDEGEIRTICHVSR